MREVVLRTLAPKQVKYDYVSIREAYGIIGDGLPVIDVDLRPGREPERKKGLVDGIAEVLNETLGVKAEDIYCIFRETPASDHYTGGGWQRSRIGNLIACIWKRLINNFKQLP